MGRRLGAWTACLAAVSALVTVAAATPAAADGPTPPPWLIGPLAAGESVGYRLSNTNPAVFQRNPNPLWGPVTLSREGNAPTTSLASEPGPGGAGWPKTWSSNGITLQRADQFCALTATSCQYYVTSGAGQPFFFAAAGTPTQDLSGFNQGALQLPPPPALVASFAPPTGGALPSAGAFTFDGSGSHDGLPGALTYRWTLTPASGAPFTQEGPQSTFTPPASIYNQNGQYCVTLVVRASDGTTANQGPSCFAVTISNPTPPPQQPTVPPPPPNLGNPTPTPAPPAAAGPSLAAPLSFAKPLPNFAVPVPGAVQQVTVIWLWKPDWFQATASGVGKAAKTAGRPTAAKRASVSVNGTSHNASPSGVPWLAGLGAFGMFGAGWLAFRRRRLRSSLLD